MRRVHHFLVSDQFIPHLEADTDEQIVLGTWNKIAKGYQVL